MSCCVGFLYSYYLVRAGESTFETRGLINTNPVTKTSVDSGLSEEGKKQTIQAAKSIRTLGACDDSCWIWPSITQRAYQTAEIIAYVNNINRRSLLSSNFTLLLYYMLIPYAMWIYVWRDLNS